MPAGAKGPAAPGPAKPEELKAALVSSKEAYKEPNVPRKM